MYSAAAGLLVADSAVAVMGCLVTVQRDPYPFPRSRDTKHVTTMQPSIVSQQSVPQV